MVVRDRRLDRAVLFAPLRQELVQRDRIDHRAREDVRTDFGPFFQNDDTQFLALFVGDLLQAYRGGETGRSRADDHDVDIHAFAFTKLVLFAHLLLPQAGKALSVAPCLQYFAAQYTTFFNSVSEIRPLFCRISPR